MTDAPDRPRPASSGAGHASSDAGSASSGAGHAPSDAGSASSGAGPASSGAGSTSSGAGSTSSGAGSAGSCTGAPHAAAITESDANLLRDVAAATPPPDPDGPAPCPVCGDLTADIVAPVADTRHIAAAIQASTSVARETLRFSSRSLLAWFLMGLLGIGLYFAYVLLQPFINTLILAVVFAALFSPVYATFLRLLRGRAALASLVVIIIVVVLVILPLTLLIFGLIAQMRMSVTNITSWLSGGNLDIIFTKYLTPIFDLVHNEAPFLGVTADSAKTDIIDASRRIGQSLVGLSAGIVGQTLTFVLNFLLFLLALFFFLKDGSAMVTRLKYLTPLREDQQERIINNLRRISKSVLVGGFLVAALQGLVGGVGLAIVGIPALFWGTVMTFAAFVPVVGTGIIWVPAVGILLFHDEWEHAIFLAAWCGLLVTSIDTFLRPFLMRDASGVPILFVFLAILGGIQAFGILGLLYGPLILTFAVVMLTIYADEYQEQLKSKNAWTKNE